MPMTSKIRILLIERNMKIKDLAKLLGWSPSNLSNKLRKDDFPESELRQIAEALHCDYEAHFVMKDSEKII